MAGSNDWGFYGRRDELGRLLEILRGRRRFFGAIRGRCRIGKTALVQQALTALEQDEGNKRDVLFFQLPDSDPADVAAVFRRAVRDAGLQDSVRDLDSLRDLPGGSFIHRAAGPLFRPRLRAPNPVKRRAAVATTKRPS